MLLWTALLMAAAAIMLTGQVDPGSLSGGTLLPAFLPLILPLSILAVPLLDLLLAVLCRTRRGRSPFSPDKQHLHHRLVLVESTHARVDHQHHGVGHGHRDGLADGAVLHDQGLGLQIDLETGEIGLHSTPLVVKDTVIVGSSFKEGMTFVTHNNTKGLVRAFDARTGKLLWTFNTIPRPGEFGNDTWENDSWAVNGNTGVWTQITVDEDLGLVYLPVETPTIDEYGGNRPGNNLFSSSLVCLDVRTGKMIWHYQLTHHDIWDRDVPTAPILADLTVGGKRIEAVVQLTKQSFAYAFDRVGGTPIWPITVIIEDSPMIMPMTIAAIEVDAAAAVDWAAGAR